MKRTALTIATLLVASATLASAHGWRATSTGSMDNHGANCCAGGSRAAMMGDGWMGCTGLWGQGTGSHGMRNGTYNHVCPWDGLALNPDGGLAEPLNEKDARALVEHLVSDNPRVTIGDIEARDKEFVIDVVTREGGVVVDRIIIDRQTGAMRPVR